MDIDVLDQKVHLLDGSSRAVFSKICVNSVFHYNCKVCRVAGLPGNNYLLIHVNGKKHKRNMLMPHRAESFDLEFRTSEYGKS